MSSKHIMILSVVAIILVFVHLIGRGQEVTGYEGFQAGSGPRFVMYYADWCPHCQSVKPAFTDFVSSGFTVGDKKVSVEMVEEKQIPADVKSSIQGYPTFILYKADGSTVDYSGPREIDAMKDFLKQNM
jgi:thiol-disulfide isomerase/thioredoxin